MIIHSPLSEPSANILLPLGLQVSFEWVKDIFPGKVLTFKVPANYEELTKSTSQPEVIAIQRLLTLVREGAQIYVEWDSAIVERVFSSASIYPLLAVLLSIDAAEHVFIGGRHNDPKTLKNIRKSILGYRFSRDFFSDSEMVICKDGSETKPSDLYSPKTLQLRPREDFETLIIDALAAQSLSLAQTSSLYERASALGVIVAELFENTDMHGRLDALGKPFMGNSLRGVIFKRIQIVLPNIRPRNEEPKTRVVDCFEISVFDSGVGYFSTYTKGSPLSSTTLIEEWKVLHNCLERHYYPNIADNRAGHRAMGLFEVLRAIQSLKGRIEIRTGRLYAYRTFLDGELQAQMRPKANFAHFAWPEPRLLDVERMYVAKPSEHEPVIGASVRIIVPLS